MKKTILTVFAAVSVLGASALTVSPAVKINTAGAAHNPVLSPDGTTMLFSSDNHTGLKALKLSDSSIITLDEAPGAGFNPIFSTDGSKVYYQTAKLIDGLLHRDVRAYDLLTQKSERISEMSREDADMLKISGKHDYVTAGFEGITISSKGITKTLNPIEEAHSYLWASLSPDGSKIAFVEPFQGVFVSDTNGENLIKVSSKGDFPAWAGDNLLTFTVSHDDGYIILDSTLKIHDLTTGITVDLTGEDVKVGESSSSSNGTVVYSTLEGEIYLFNVK